MIASKRRAERQPPKRSVLVLQGDRAHWFREADQGQWEIFAESLEAGGLELRTHCPWVRQTDDLSVDTIHLVLDSHLDEVDRVRVTDMAGGWLRHWQWRRMRRRLRADFPDASVHPLPAYAAPDVMSIVHNLLPEYWTVWLERLQQHVCISHVASSIELLARFVAEHGQVQGKPVLFNVPAGGYVRHLLLDGDVPMFMRLVSSGNGNGKLPEAGSIAQSLAHVRKQIVGAELEPMILFPKQMDESSSNGARLMADLCLGKPVDFDCVSSAAVSSTAQCGDALSGDGTRNGQQASPVGFIAPWRRGRPGRRWRLTKGHRFADGVLQASVANKALQQRNRLLQRATLVCVWLTAAAVVTASAHGVANARQRSRLSLEQQRLLEQIRQLSATAPELNGNPRFLLHSLERIDRQQQVKPPDAGIVLRVLADALEKFPALRLDDLAWSAFHEDPHDAVFTTAAQAPARTRLWTEDSMVPPLQIELGGSVSDERGLRAQQDILEAFVRELESLPGTADVKVLESPAHVARSSEYLSGQASAYRVSLRLEE